MSAFGKKTVKVAILDLYAGVANQGMRCLRDSEPVWRDEQP